MAIPEKDQVVLGQVQDAWTCAAPQLADCPFSMNVLETAQGACDDLFDALIERFGTTAGRTWRTQQRQEVEARLHKIFGLALDRLREAAYARTHDEQGRPLDFQAWEVQRKLIAAALPEGRRSNLPLGGPALLRRLRWSCEFLEKALPDAAGILAPVRQVMDEYQVHVDQRGEDLETRRLTSAELEARRKRAARLRRATYYYLKFMEAWDPSFDADVDGIFANPKTEAANKRKKQEAREAAKAGEAAEPTENEGAPEDPEGGHPIEAA